MLYSGSSIRAPYLTRRRAIPKLADLAEHYGPLAFLFPGQPKPTFGNDRVAVTRQVADCLAECFQRFRKRGVDQPTAQRFILQILVALFAEDIDLLPKYFVTQLLDEIKSPTESYDLLGGLFAAMNTTPSPTGGRFKGVAYLNGVEVLTIGGAGERFVLDFEQMNQLDASTLSGAFAWVQEHVLPDRQRKAEEGKDADGNMRPHHKGFLSRWWQLGFGRPEMLSVIKPLPRYLACAYVTKRPIFLFISQKFRPSNLIQVFGFEDDYSFGILQSHAHWLWFVTKCGKLTERFRYSAESVFDTFPWPQTPDEKAIAAVAAAGREVRRIRAESLPKLKGGLRALYRTLELPGANPLKAAHAALDAAVLAAYGFNPKGDLLAHLLALNQQVAARLAAGDPVTAPGLPLPPDKHGAYITEDSIQPPGL